MSPSDRLPLSVREILRVARHYATSRYGTPLVLIDEAERWIRAGLDFGPPLSTFNDEPDFASLLDDLTNAMITSGVIGKGPL